MVDTASLILLFPAKQALGDLLVDEGADRQVGWGCVQCSPGGKRHSLPWAVGLEHVRWQGPDRLLFLPVCQGYSLAKSKCIFSSGTVPRFWVGERDELLREMLLYPPPSSPSLTSGNWVPCSQRS